MRKIRAAYAAVPLGVAIALVSPAARAIDLGTGGGPPSLDVSETSILAQRFDARDLEARQDSGWGDWMNRLNAALRWGHWTAGLRLDSAVFWRRPLNNPNFPDLLSSEQQTILNDSQSRFHNALYPAKGWLTYAAPGLEMTVGDSYVQFGRGLTLSMRKVDQLGIDTTVRGAKVSYNRDPFSVTAVAGWANPSRIDEATGRELFLTYPAIAGTPSMPTYGSDRVIGVDVQAGRGMPVTVSAHAVRFSRCAPYTYNPAGGVYSNLSSDPSGVMFGTCSNTDTSTWLSGLDTVPRGLKARDITMPGLSVEVPSLWGHGQLYVEFAAQERQSDLPGAQTNTDGNALYAALTVDESSATTSTLEIKSNRNFYTVAASVAPTAPEFAIVAYSFLPPAESFNMLDAEGTGDFNACVEGGRLRQDFNVNDSLLLWGQGVYAYSQTEQPDGSCDSAGHTISSVPAAQVQDVAWDGAAGVEWSFDDKQSHLFASTGARDDTKEDGDFSYREQHIEYSLSKYLGGTWSLELQGRHRHRREQQMNLDPTTYTAGWWSEGDDYLALRMAPKWVFTAGFEYTTLTGQPPLYFNGAVLYKFTSDSSVSVFAGQQRGAFRCASGICRFFPAFEGARSELTLRF